jgi:CSLREA domain-containing protein
VTTVADHDDGCDAVDCTLREAINAANQGAASDIIRFAPGLTGTIQLSAALPTLSSNISITGPGQSLLTVRRNSGGNYRIFTVSNGLTISNGLASSGNAGGGIFNDRGTLNVASCHITGNSSDPASSSEGGGIYNLDGTLGVNNSSLSANNAYYGGGIANRRNTGGTAAVTVTNTTFAGNNAPNGFGGAIFNQGGGTVGAPGAAMMVLTNCTLSGNSAGNSFGGAIYNAGLQPGTGSTTLTNCTLTGNSATHGGIFNFNLGSSVELILRNTILKTGPAGANLVNSGGTITSQGHNLSNDNGGGFLTGVNDQINTEPQLGALASNGGPTQTHALLAVSPAINTGNDALAPPVDQRGYGRNGISDKGAFEFNGTPPVAPAVVSVVSRKAHGASGTFDINLPFTPPAGVECRTGGTGRNHQVVVTFANPVTVGGVGVTSIDGMATAAQSAGGAVVTINLANVANAQTAGITLTNVNDGTNDGDISIPFRVLVGDTTNNGSVNATDVGQVKSQSGQKVAASNFRLDVTANGGSISASDIGLVKSASGTQLP